MSARDFSIGGMRGEDNGAEIDFRLFSDELVEGRAWTDAVAKFVEAMRHLQKDDVKLDGVWPRTISETGEELERWLGGHPSPKEMPWLIWGYHLPGDIYHQKSIDDPYGILAGWLEQLSRYPVALKRAILDKHLGSLKYWRKDHHLAERVGHGDVVFASAITARLVHDILQVIFALNDAYFVGDANVPHFAADFSVRPANLDERVTAILYPGTSGTALNDQYEMLLRLIGEVEELGNGSH